MKQFTRILPLVAVAAFAAACTDAIAPVAPQPRQPEFSAPTDPATLLKLTCTASITARKVSCDSPVAADGSNRDIIIGGQNTYVTLTSSNIAITGTEFAFDATVTNLIPQPLGTTNGSSADASGIRVFFHTGPTSSGTGTVTVGNPDGTATFTGVNQPYFQYAGLLAQSATSAAKRWKLNFTPDVTNFTFTVYVSTNVQYPNGYVDGTYYVLTLDPNEARTLTGIARSAVGNALPDAISWSSDAPTTAAVSGTQVTAGAARGTATLTPTAGTRPGIYTTAVSVCQSTVVANNANIPSSIAASDCFSSYGDPNGRPTSSYYADLYRVTLTAGQTITVIMDSGDDLDTYLLLAGPQMGTLVAGNDDDDDGDLGVGSKMVYTATVSGVYVIEASTFNGLDTGNYTLKITIN